MENKELKEGFIDERTGIEYVRPGDYYIPNLVLPKQNYIKWINIGVKIYRFNGKILNFMI